MALDDVKWPTHRTSFLPSFLLPNLNAIQPNPIPKYAPHELGAVRERRPGKGLAQGRVGAAAVGETRNQGVARYGVGEPFDGVGAAVHAFHTAPHGGVAAVTCCGCCWGVCVWWGGGGSVGQPLRL